MNTNTFCYETRHLTRLVENPGITQTIPILEAQDVMKTTYFYVENIGLVRAETTQGISLSNQLVSVLSLLNITLDFPTNITIENIEELRDFSVE